MEQVGSSGDVYDLHVVCGRAECLPGQELLWTRLLQFFICHSI